MFSATVDDDDMLSDRSVEVEDIWVDDDDDDDDDCDDDVDLAWVELLDELLY